MIRQWLWLSWGLAGLSIGCATKTDGPRASASESAASADPTAQPPGRKADSASTATNASTASLTLVTDRSLVCMVNNQFMGLPQIPIDVEGRTYYGCCEMCKGRLGSDPSSRVATDPVNQNVVDKATAVIGKTASGRTLYFENDQTFAAYAQRTSR